MGTAPIYIYIYIPSIHYHNASISTMHAPSVPCPPPSTAHERPLLVIMTSCTFSGDGQSDSKLKALQQELEKAQMDRT